MDSNTQDVKIISRDGKVLPENAIEQLTTTVNCEVLIKGKVAEEVYLTAIDRFNKAGILEAVCIS